MPSAERRLIDLSATDTVDSIIAQIKTQPSPLILLLGDYDVSLDPTVRSLFSRALIPAAMGSGVVIIDNGANSGCSAAVGQAARDEDHGPTLFGIAPHGADQLEPNHTTIVRLTAEWSDPMKTLIQIAGELAKDTAAIDRPVLVVLFGGGSAEKGALVRCARREWPMLIVQGSGGTADEILKAMEPTADGKPQPPLPIPICARSLRRPTFTSSQFPGTSMTSTEFCWPESICVSIPLPIAGRDTTTSIRQP